MHQNKASVVRSGAISYYGISFILLKKTATFQTLQLLIQHLPPAGRCVESVSFLHMHVARQPYFEYGHYKVHPSSQVKIDVVWVAIGN